MEDVIAALTREPLPDPDSPVDLHTHTDASDGSHPPKELVRLASDAGLAALAVTDHDTLGGLPEALEAGNVFGVRVIPGVELSCRIPGGTLHILGYFIPLGAACIEDKLTWLRDQRLSRGEKIVRRLNDLGLDLDLELVKEKAGGASLGRPHIAQALIDAGHVKDATEAFETYLKKGAPAYVDKAVLSKQDALGAILGCGGVPVMAHPYQTNREGEELETLVEELKDLGLMGIEAHYSLHDDDMTSSYLALAKKYGLKVTGGTDFHGPRKPGIQLGRGKGDLHIPFRLVQGLLEARSAGAGCGGE